MTFERIYVHKPAIGPKMEVRVNFTLAESDILVSLFSPPKLFIIL